MSAGISALALPFVVIARREHASSDPIARDGVDEKRTHDPLDDAFATA